ncbi:TPM domain-containing protein [Volucribacter amazonae]|uniref:Methanol dehydrogenase n=1 Tax=Volucribacter amazonae TaxID=256731 RepID=A0A9X4P7W6_9PAST|nr:TPM domain-containing protein [Volucribacter amazonae]MDG6894153.1 methanol dehydrogenase [Volucribacter amazonae]
MIRAMWQKSAVLFAFIFAAVQALAVELPNPPNPFRYVNDYTHTLSQAELAQLEKALQQYSQQTSSQIAVVMLPTVGDRDIAQYAFALGDKWGIGRKQLDNGVLMLIAKNDRKIFIATGQGLEGALPDAFLSQLIRQQITPYFRENQYAQGIANGLSAIIAASQGEYAAYQAEQSSDLADFLPLIIFALIVAFWLFRLLGGNQVYISPTSQRSSSSRRNNHFGGFGGGGFGGGSGGGFGGGGFGGGGAGGSW